MDWHLSLLPTFPKTLVQLIRTSESMVEQSKIIWPRSTRRWIRRSMANALSIETMGSRATPCASLWIGLNSANLETRESLACHRVSRWFPRRGRTLRTVDYPSIALDGQIYGTDDRFLELFDARKSDLVKVFNDGSGRWRCRWTNTRRTRISENSSFVSFAFVGREPTYKPSIKLSKPCC